MYMYKFDLCDKPYAILSLFPLPTILRPPSLKDLESLEPAFYSSLLWIRENDPEPLDLTFTVEEEAFGQLSTHELKEGGSDIPVTDENKEVGRRSVCWGGKNSV